MHNWHGIIYSYSFTFLPVDEIKIFLVAFPKKINMLIKWSNCGFVYVFVDFILCLCGCYLGQVSLVKEILISIVHPRKIQVNKLNK